MLDLRPVACAIAEATCAEVVIRHGQAVVGGCINQSEVIALVDGRKYFVKFNLAAFGAMFAAEAAGLNEILAVDVLRVPRPICHGFSGEHAFLVLEYLALDGRGDAMELGRQLAALHRHTCAKFGWHRDNTIGATPQRNNWCADWPSFWREHRFRPQLEMAASRGAPRRLIENGKHLLDGVEALLENHQPQASLLHGDLWGGNFAYSEGHPVLYDPAVYFGDRETDLAMSELFGGFPVAFYAGYQQAWPLDAGYARRRTFYNLYHILNHFNLFGGGYASQAEHMCAGLLSDLDNR